MKRIKNEFELDEILREIAIFISDKNKKCPTSYSKTHQEGKIKRIEVIAYIKEGKEA